MSTQTENAIAYFESMRDLTSNFFGSNGVRLFDMQGGKAEAKNIIETIEAGRKLHPRSKCWGRALDAWINLIKVTVIDQGSEDALDWAVLQGNLYGCWELPDVPASYFDNANN